MRDDYPGLECGGDPTQSSDVSGENESGGGRTTNLEYMEVESTQDEAKDRHDQVLSVTTSMLYQWMIVISINFFAHYMRMGISLSYMTHHLGASELDAGAVITLHMALIGLANAYLSFSMDTHSFETMVAARFGLLVLVTLAEWLAQDFIQFAIAYTCASLSVIWMSVANGYFIKLLPIGQAKKISGLNGMLNRVGTLLGLGLGGCLAGSISFSSVFLCSFVVSLLSLVFILVFVIGKEKRIKQMQCDEIAPLYHAYPHLFPDEESRFPMPFMNKEETSLSINQESKSIFRTEDGIPFAMYLIFVGLNTAEKTEVLVWWNVYAMQVMDQSVAVSNAQMICAILASVIGLIISLKITQANRMPVNKLLNWSVLAYSIVGTLTALAYIFVFPHLTFDYFWFAFPLIYFVDPSAFRYSVQVIESPAHQAGAAFAAIILSRSLIPAMQHIIIGALWNVGGPKHPWFFRWFGLLSVMSSVVFILYFFVKRWVLSRNGNINENDQYHHPYQVISNEESEL